MDGLIKAESQDGGPVYLRLRDVVAVAGYEAGSAVLLTGGHQLHVTSDPEAFAAFMIEASGWVDQTGGHTRRLASGGAADWLSSTQAAQRLGVSTQTIRRMVKQGKLPARATPGGHLRIALADVDHVSRRSTKRAEHR